MVGLAAGVTSGLSSSWTLAPRTQLMSSDLVMPPAPVVVMLANPAAAVAGVTGLTGTVYVNVLAAAFTPAITKVPLYSLCVAPEIVMLLPLAKLAGAAVGSVVVVTVAVVPLRVIDAIVSDVPGSAFMMVAVVAGVTGPVDARLYRNVVVVGTAVIVNEPL